MGEAQRRMDLGMMPKGPKPGEPIQVNVDLSKATQKLCLCGCALFIPVVQVFTVSALLSPVGKELTVQQPVLICKNCGVELFKTS